MTTKEINKIHTQGLAIFGKKYYDNLGNVYIGTETKRLRIVDKAEISDFKPTSTIIAKNVQEAIENLEKRLITRTKQVEVDFGTDFYQKQKLFAITDSDIVSTNKITAQIAYIKPSTKDLDELDMDEMNLKCGSGEGFTTILISSLTGSLHGKFPVNYQINY